MLGTRSALPNTSSDASTAPGAIRTAHRSEVTMIDQTAEALTDYGNRAMEQGNDALARWLYQEGLALWQALDFQPGIAHLLERLERLAWRSNRAVGPHAAAAGGAAHAPGL